MSRRSKVTVVGGGNVGATLAQRLVQKAYADVVLVDIIDSLPQGKALDIQESGPILGFDSRIIGANEYADTADSDIVVITAGLPRKPGMSRDDLLLTNQKIVQGIVREVVKYSPNCVMVIISNPLDAMCQVALHESRFPRTRVVGMAGILDTARFRIFLAQELDVSVEDVQAYVLGGHGDTMVPLVRYATAGGIPVGEMIGRERLAQIVQRTRDGGAEIVAHLKTGGAYYAPSAAGLEMVEAILLDQKRILPCAVYLEGEYGVKGVYVGVPAKLGAAGLEEILQVKLTKREMMEFHASANSVRRLVGIMGI